MTLLFNEPEKVQKSYKFFLPVFKSLKLIKLIKKMNFNNSIHV
jgi:hypothetical protein